MSPRRPPAGPAPPRRTARVRRRWPPPGAARPRRGPCAGGGAGGACGPESPPPAGRGGVPVLGPLRASRSLLLLAPRPLRRQPRPRGRWRRPPGASPAGRSFGRFLRVRRALAGGSAFCSGRLEANAAASSSTSAGRSARAASIVRAAIASCVSAAASAAAAIGSSTWRSDATSSRARTWCSSPREDASVRRRSRMAGLAAVAARYWVSREARASFHVQVRRCDCRAGQRCRPRSPRAARGRPGRGRSTTSAPPRSSAPCGRSC